MAPEVAQVAEYWTYRAIYALTCGLLGAVPFAWVLGRWAGIDIRAVGSGNVGATNLARVKGIHWGVLAFLLDAGKGWGPVVVGHVLGYERWMMVVGGAVAVVGHCYSPYLRFRGGKGVATVAGVLAALDYRVFLGLLIVWGAMAWAIRNVGIASTLTALAAVAVGVWFLFIPTARLADGSRDGVQVVGAFLIVLSALVIFRHRSNVVDFIRRTSKEPRP